MMDMFARDWAAFSLVQPAVFPVMDVPWQGVGGRPPFFTICDAISARRGWPAINS